MLLYSATPKAPDFRAFAAPARCARCGDVMVAPLMSEFAEGEIPPPLGLRSLRRRHPHRDPARRRLAE